MALKLYRCSAGCVTSQFCCLQILSMGRPRKLDKMTRVVTARVTDDQWDWLEERAIELLASR